MTHIKAVKAREILDSRGKKTIEVELVTNDGRFWASVPSGTSTGKREAAVVEPKRAVQNIEKIIAPAMVGKPIISQQSVDRLLIKLDGTKNKKRLGANAILAVSIAAARSGAAARKFPLWKHISKIARTKPRLPKPAVLLIEGGLHGKTSLDIQEFMAVPEGKMFREQFLKGKKIYKRLKIILRKKFGKRGNTTGLEGAFTPSSSISDPRAALDLIMEATNPHTTFDGVGAKGYNVKIYLDCAGSNLRKGKYDTAFYQKLIKDYPVALLEDPFGEDDWQEWTNLSFKFKVKSSKLLLVADDLTVTNPERIRQARRKRACNAVIIKPNQIGTVTEAIEAAKLAKSYGWKTIVSHRSGETMDDFIADLAVGIGADFIKAGAPSKPERMAKYSRLLKIEKELWRN